LDAWKDWNHLWKKVRILSLRSHYRLTADMRLQPSAFAQILASLELLISAKR